MYKEYMNFAIDIAEYAGNIMLKYFNEDNGSSYKYDQTIVTKADTEINSYLINRVKETYPEHSVDGEEEKYGKSNYVWLCDPVDGTAMYARHIPVAVFSLALCIDGNPVVGVIFDPFTNNMYTAIKGEGAYRNGERIEVNNYEFDDIKSVSHYDMWYKAEYNIYDVIKELGQESYIVSIGSIIRASMCVANGEFVSAIFPGTINKNVDIAAVKIIVEEAGGKVTDLFGNEQRYDREINGAIITNNKDHTKIINTVKKYLTNKK